MRSRLRFHPSGAVKALIAAPACLAFATGASAAGGLAPTEAAKRLQWQYHGGWGAETALRAEREVGAGHAVSPAARRAISRIRGIQILVPIDARIITEIWRSIVPRIAVQNYGSAEAYARPNVRSDIVSGSRSKAHGTQYQVLGIWYQPRYPKLEPRNDPRRPVAIEAVATKSAQGSPARPNTQENVRDTRVMVGIGLLLGLGYLLFLTLWFWATRVRPRPTRAGRGIDTGRRIE